MNKNRVAQYLFGVCVVGVISATGAVPIFEYSFPASHDGTGTVLTDQSTAGNNATLHAEAALIDDRPSGFDAFLMSLSGSNGGHGLTDAIDLLNTTDVATHGGFTLDVWFKWNGSFTDTRKLIDYAGTEYLRTRDSKIQFSLSNESTLLSHDITSNHWYHAEAIFDTLGNSAVTDTNYPGDYRVDGFAWLYIDGVLVDSSAATKTGFGDSLNRSIGLNMWPGNGNWNQGNIFNPSVYLGVYTGGSPVIPSLDYAAWAAEWGGLDIGSETNDYDHDGLSNLYEFGLDGDPTNEFDQGTFPAYSVVEEGGSNVLRCIHPQRSNPKSGLVYALEITTNLVSGNWTTTGYEITGTNSPGGLLDFVTNTVDMAARQKFIRLNIGNPSFILWQLPSQSGTQMMSYVIESEDGKVVVIDGGWEEDAVYLRSFIAARGYYVDAWVITHPHGDHIEALTWILLNPGGTVIDHIYASFPPMDWFDQYAPGAGGSLQDFFDALAAGGKSYIDVDPGDMFDVDEIHIEILSVENTNITVNAANNSSLMFRVSDPAKSVLFTGDLGDLAGAYLLGVVDPQKLMADYVQMAHHGQDGVSEAFYQAVQPRFGLWPTPLWLWNNDNGGGYDSGPWTTLDTRQWMEDLNVKSNYVSGVSGLIKIK